MFPVDGLPDGGSGGYVVLSASPVVVVLALESNVLD